MLPASVANGPIAARRRAARARARFVFDSVLVVLLVGTALAPRVLRGRSALEWTRHLSARSGMTPRPADAREITRWARRAADLLAPLPYAAEAAHLALDVGQRVEAIDRAAARTLYADLLRTLDALSESRWRGLSLGPARTRARELLAQTEAPAPPEPSP